MSTVWFATGNVGKLKEVQEIFSTIGLDVEQLFAPYPELQVDTLREVVEHGLQHLWKEHKKPLMIDDSGLFIDDILGFPGVYSAYVYRTLGCDGVLQLLKMREDRSAHFECCAGHIDENGKITIAEGRVDGRIILENKGEGGFGYDPIFVPEGQDLTFAQLSMDEKNQESHRSRAFDALVGKLRLGD